jgi:hypothetical protein
MASKIIVDQLEKTGGALTALTLPVANATANQYIKNDGAGALSWATLPTGGKVLQVVQTVKTDTASTTAVTTSLVDITDMTVDITPTAADSKVLVFWNVNLCGVANRRLNIRLAQVISSVETYPLIGDTAGSRTRVTSQGSPTNAQGMANISVQYLASPATVSTVTYKLQWSANVAGTTYLNRGESPDTDNAEYTRQTSSIMVMEIGA